MPKKIIFCTGMFHPQNEAISKEIELLKNKYDKSFVYSRSSFFELGYGNKVFRYWNKLKFLDKLLEYVEPKYDISHIYHVINNNFYIDKLKRNPVILTACSENDDIAEIKHYVNKINMIVVQSEKIKTKLISKGIPSEKIKIIYPGIDLKKYGYKKRIEGKNSNFRILFASAPLFPGYFKARGVDLLLNSSTVLSNVEIVLLWRKKVGGHIKRRLSKSSNLRLIDKTIRDMPSMYQNIDATVVPFTIEQFNKSCPNSIIESLAGGKPVLVSHKVGISSLIEKEKCGVVFEPNENNFIKAVNKLRTNYDLYQGRTIYAANKYFSIEKFYHEYDKLYSDVLCGLPY